MIIYTDSIANGIGGGEMTPAHVYATVRDFSTILDEISKGNLPTNSQKPFPVNWAGDNENNGVSTNLWQQSNDQYYQQPQSFYNPLI